MKTKNRNSQNHYLSFFLGNEKYALHVSQVREILELPDITRVPLMADTIRGVFNLRGNVVPVFSLKRKFGIESTESNEEQNILVCESRIDSETVILGILADNVEEVIQLDKKDIEPPPQMEDKGEEKYISGMGKKDGSFIIILNINNIIDEEDIKTIELEKNHEK